MPFKTYPSKIALGKGKYCSVECTNEAFKGMHSSPETQFKKGQMPANFKGYRFTTSRPQSGTYKYIYLPSHPNATGSGHVREHRLVMERVLGGYLREDEVVDHINMDTLDNRPENLRVMLKTDHDRMNVKLNVHRRWVERGGGYYAKEQSRVEAIP